MYVYTYICRHKLKRFHCILFGKQVGVTKEKHPVSSSDVEIADCSLHMDKWGLGIQNQLKGYPQCTLGSLEVLQIVARSDLPLFRFTGEKLILYPLKPSSPPLPPILISTLTSHPHLHPYLPSSSPPLPPIFISTLTSHPHLHPYLPILTIALNQVIYSKLNLQNISQQMLC